MENIDTLNFLDYSTSNVSDSNIDEVISSSKKASNILFT